MPTPSAFSRPHADCSWVSGQGPRACCCLDSWLLPICRHLRAAEPSTALKLYLIMKVNAPIRRLLWYILKHELGDWGWYGVMLTQQCDWWDVCVMWCVCVWVCVFACVVWGLIRRMWTTWKSCARDTSSTWTAWLQVYNVSWVMYLSSIIL